MRKSIFISYSHHDKNWLEKLKPFLKILEQKASMETFGN